MVDDGSIECGVVIGMGCCPSKSGQTSKSGQRIWWMPWKRRRKVDKDPEPPPSKYRGSSRGGGAGYEKTVGSVASEASSVSQMGDQHYVALWKYTPGSKAELSLQVGDKLRLMGDPAGEST